MLNRNGHLLFTTCALFINIVHLFSLTLFYILFSCFLVDLVSNKRLYKSRRFEIRARPKNKMKYTEREQNRNIARNFETDLNIARIIDTEPDRINGQNQTKASQES